jgi:NADP-dependent 3-hydroxy acid dehydrogenase YdfG
MSTAIMEKFGGIDILINAAGLIFDGDIETTYP